MVFLMPIFSCRPLFVTISRRSDSKHIIARYQEHIWADHNTISIVTICRTRVISSPRMKGRAPPSTAPPKNMRRKLFRPNCEGKSKKPHSRLPANSQRTPIYNNSGTIEIKMDNTRSAPHTIHTKGARMRFVAVYHRLQRKIYAR